MTGAVANDPRVVELASELQALDAELAAKRARLGELQAAHAAARRTKGPGTADRLHDLDVEQQACETEIARLEQELADVRQRDTAAREAAARAAQERERAAADREVTATAAAVTAPALTLVRALRLHRAALERLAAAEVAISGRADDARAVIVSRNAGGVIQALEPVMSWVTHDPAVQPLARDYYGTPRKPKWTDPIGQLVAQFFAAWNEQQDHAGGV